jgi:hypothetical protein
MKPISSIVVLACVGCASAPTIPAARFANAPAVSIVDDRRDVAKQPGELEFLPDLYLFRSSLERVVTRPLELPRHLRALEVNAIDEVPDSTWFTNRIGAKSLTPDQVRQGPVTRDPMQHLPWTIESSKIGGSTPGLIVKDAAGVKYLLKFDYRASPAELETGTHLVVNRIMWAAGYNVAEDQIVYLHRKDLVIGKTAKHKDSLGKTLGPLTQDYVDNVLASGREDSVRGMRVLASRWIDGKVIGGHASEGVRDDDPNDRIAHERRRDLRGLWVFDAWTDAVDVTEGQFVDTWVEDPAIPKLHYVKHYAIDFGKSMGAMGQIDFDWWRGHAYRIDFPSMFHELITFGVTSRPWEQRVDREQLEGVSSLFDVDSLEPASWHPDIPGYMPLQDADRFDKFWATKIVARFTREQIAGAVAAAKFSDPRAAAYLVDTLVGRQHKLAAYWFARVNPLDRFAVEPDGVCFDDLAITTALSTSAETSYAVRSYDWNGHALGPVDAVTRFSARVGGRSCAANVPVAVDHDGYTIYRIDTVRAAFAGSTYVHVARDPATGSSRVIGVWRP